jgi:hypothetical protein
VGIGIAIVEIARTDMRRKMTAAVIVRIIVGDRWDYGQVKRSAPTIFDLDHIIPGAFPGLQKG